MSPAIAAIAATVSLLFVVERIDDRSREALTSQAEQIGEALDALYEEPITYERPPCLEIQGDVQPPRRSSSTAPTAPAALTI